MNDDNARLLDAARRLLQALQPGDLEETLTSITKTAVEILPQVEYSSITIAHSDGRVETSAPTHDLLREIDEAQADLKEGPCFDAASDRAYVCSPNLGNDERFPRFGPIAVEHGVRSQAGLRLFDTPKSRGALNLYSTKVGGLDNEIEHIGALFSHQSAVAIAYAYEVGNLREAVKTRTLIGQATGIVMERYGLPDDRAFAFLTRLSQHRNVKLRRVAEEIIAANESRQDDKRGG